MHSMLPKRNGVVTFIPVVISALFILSLAFVFSACDSGKGGGTASPKETPAKPTQTATSSTTPWTFVAPIKTPLTATVGTQTVTLGDLATQQVKVVISPGMLPAGTKITVTNPENPVPVASSVGKPISAPVKISMGDSASGDAPVRLDQLVTVTLKFDTSKLSSGSDPTTLWAAFYDTGSKRWEIFQPDQVDMKAATMTFTMGHLTNVTAIDIPLGTYTQKIVGNKAVADALNEKVGKAAIDKMVEKGIDHVLKDGLGLKDDSTKSKVYSSLVKDGEWGDIAAKGATIVGQGKDASADDVVDLVQTVNTFVGKKMVENIPEGQLADALTKLSPDKFAQYKEDGASQGYENAVSWTKAGSTAAGYLAEKRYTDAARVIGEQIADGVPLVKAVKASAEVIDYGITKWKNAEVEAAYKAFKNGASITSGNSTFGIGSKYDVNKGAFDDVWNQMTSVDTWIQGQAVRAEERARAEDSSYGKLPLTDAERTRIMEKAKADLKADFEERARREAEIEKVQADLQDLLDKAKALDMLDGASSLRYNPDTLETRVKTILSARAMIVRDTWGLKGKKVTNQDIAELAKWFLSGRDQAEGRQLYWKELKRRFGIDLSAKAAVAPTPTPVPAGSWVLVERKEEPFVPGSSTQGVVASANIAGRTISAAVTWRQNKSAWTCGWPEPPQKLKAGDKWTGTVSLSDAGSFKTPVLIGEAIIGKEPVAGQIQGQALLTTWIQMSGTPASWVRPPDLEARATEGTTSRSFSWPIPDPKFQTGSSGQLVVTADCRVGIFFQQGGTQGAAATVRYTYKWQPSP